MSDSTEGYIWIPSNTPEKAWNDIEKYFKKMVAFESYEEAMQCEGEAYEHQWEDFKYEGPMMLVKLSVEVMHAGFSDEPDYDYFDGPYEEVSHG